jgi:DNA helicase HerA-like ATPase
MLDIQDWMRLDENGKGVINILSAEKLYQMPKLYAASLLWMLSELYERLPEAGDLEKPKLVFFFDEAHLLFNDAPQVLLDKIEQVIRLIRSKAVGFTSCRRTRRIFPMRFSASWATAFSTPCAPLRRKIRKR